MNELEFDSIHFSIAEIQNQSKIPYFVFSFITFDLIEINQYNILN